MLHRRVCVVGLRGVVEGISPFVVYISIPLLTYYYPQWGPKHCKLRNNNKIRNAL